LDIVLLAQTTFVFRHKPIKETEVEKIDSFRVQVRIMANLDLIKTKFEIIEFISLH